MSEVQELIELLEKKAPMTAMVAPSFPIVYDHRNLVGMLKRLGFLKVMEVTLGAEETNKMLQAALQNQPEARFITSPCPSLVRLVRAQYPELKPYLAFAVDSPMIASARIVQEKFPGTRPVFIGPCVAKKFESKEDYPELDILVLNYKEMTEVFGHFNFEPQPEDLGQRFDLEATHTRLYPISGGLAQSSFLREVLAEDQYEVVSGWERCKHALERFRLNEKVRVLDILFCDGGCINGAGVGSELTINQRQDRVIQYWLEGQST